MIDKEIVIIGAGITGLTAGYYLKKAHKDILVIDTRNRVGGVINSVQDGEFLYEEGPNTGVLTSIATADLFEDLGDKCPPLLAGEGVDKRYICKHSKLHPLPLNIIQAAFTPLFTWYDKFRVLLEPFRKRATDPHQTLASMVRRRLGKSFLNYAVDPFILGIYSGDPAKLIPKYALPKLHILEQEYGGFIRGAIKKYRTPKTLEEQKITRKIFSCKKGLVSLPNAIAEEIGDDKFLLGAKEVTITREESHFIVTMKNALGEEFKIKTKKVITTTGASSLPDLLPFVKKDQLTPITNLSYAKVIEVSVGYKKWDGDALDGFGALIPFKEQRDILGILYMSTLFKNRAPEGGALLSIFIGGVRREELTQLTDSEIKVILKKEISELLSTDAEPNLITIGRYQRAIPQYYADSQDRFNAIDKIETQYPGLILGGNIRDGIGMSNRIQQGRNIADSLT